jgi:hypothetical protein
VGKKCVQIGTHGDGLSAETEEMSLSPGAPQAWTPGACPADYGELLCILYYYLKSLRGS